MSGPLAPPHAKYLEGLNDHLVRPDTKVRAVLELFNRAVHQLCLVVDDDGHLLGTVTDGDIRRGILQGVTPDDAVERCMHRSPRAGRTDQPLDHARLMKGLPFLPLVDRGSRVAAVLIPSEYPSGFSEAIVMVGGLGQRLGALTENVPKPLLPVGGKPILEHILDNLEAAGISRVWLAVNHLADQFKEFAEKRANTAEIRFLCEPMKMGTAGALGLLPEPPEGPVLVLNGDVLTQVNLTALDAFHQAHHLDATVAVAHHQIHVPFGVVHHDQHGLFTGIEEKPVLTHFVAAGIYCLSPRIISLVPRNQRKDMPDVLNEAHKAGLRLGLFPIHEYWADVGYPQDLQAADAYHRAKIQ